MHPILISAIVTAVLVVWIAVVLAINVKRHPQGLFTLFFAELWERFSFYGMRALLVLYMTKALAYDDTKAYAVYAAYGALVYTTPAIGGLIADRLIGYQRAIMIGAIFMAIGHFVLAIEHEVFFYAALAFLIVGNGFFKPNISSLVGKLYPEGDARRDGGFTLFYMGINAGAFLAPLWCGVIGETYGWHYGFGLAGVGMVAGLVVFAVRRHVFGDKGLPPDQAALAKPILPGINISTAVVAAAVIAVPLMGLLVRFDRKIVFPVGAEGFSPGTILTLLLALVAIVVVGGVLVSAFKGPKVERERIFVALILTAFSVIFWAFFEQAGSSISLFTDRNVNRVVFGAEVPASTFQALNPAFILVFAPILAGLWVWLSKVGREPSTPFKFVLGIVQLGLGFGVMVVGARAAGSDGIVPVIYLVIGYLLHTTGELCVSPVGLSMVTKLAPLKMVGLMMGVWFLSSAFAHNVGGIIAALTSAPNVEGAAVTDPALTLPLYSGVFNSLFYVSLGTAAVLLLLVPVLKKWMHGVR